MKTVIINKLRLINFMGAKDFTLEPNGESLKVYGDNGSGKSTLYHALNWILFDKNADNAKDFQIKPIVNGAEQHMLDSTVELDLVIDGQLVQLKKVYHEVWKKKSGSPKSTFDGHAQKYWIDLVPKKKKDFTEFIESVVPENIFKLLTNSNFFNEALKWTERRKILLDVAGDVSDDEIMQSRTDLKDLANALQGKGVEDFRLMKAERKTAINKELSMIPIRVDEIKRSLPDNVGDEKKLNQRMNELDAELERLREKINSIRSGGEIQTKKAELQELENQLREQEFAAKGEHQQEIYKLKTKIMEEQSNIQNIERKRDRAQDEMRRLTAEAERVSKEKDALMAEYQEWNKKAFEAHADCSCPTCGQDLPEEQVNAAKEKALASFNLTKSQKLERIKADGLARKQKLDELSAQHSRNKALSDDSADEIIKKDKSLAKLKESLESSEKALKTDADNLEVAGIKNDIIALKEQIGGLTEGISEAVASVEDDIRNVQEEKRTVSEQLQKLAGIPAANKRVDELMQQEEALSQEYERIEHLIYLTEEFMRAKVNILTERINEKFEYASFKLFKQLVNGSLEECCEVMVNGIQYDKGLNNAARINSGIDVSNVLSKHYGISLPQFVDNAEAVVNLLPSDSQTIQLIVSGEDKELRVEKVAV